MSFNFREDIFQEIISGKKKKIQRVALRQKDEYRPFNVILDKCPMGLSKGHVTLQRRNLGPQWTIDQGPISQKFDVKIKLRVIFV